MPGRTFKTLRQVDFSISTNSGTSGRGPTRLISARTTFQSCGSSSSLNLRKIRPIFVTRESPCAVIEGPEILCLIVRNLNRRNGFPSRPTLICAKKIGHPLSHKVAIAITKSIGESMKSPHAAIKLIEYLSSPTCFRYLHAVNPGISGGNLDHRRVKHQTAYC